MAIVVGLMLADLLHSVLDLSFNLLRHVPDTLKHLASLRTVYFVQNRISKISGFEYVVTLRSLELGGNKIRVRISLSVACKDTWLMRCSSEN